ncbi:MAG: tRNA-dihydrouridine synthase, partial [Pseudomonadota bacterium]
MICLTPLSPVMPVFMAPMAGITDLPFRRQVARFGAGLVFSEMVVSLYELLKGIPAFLFSLGILMLFWNSHVVFSRRYGLD